ncbi:hypothetical protein ABH14_15065 [Brevibacillus brevis]|uniref:hypothetical protein n=1 Tax=Brevibacillus brevis TaxID=1393 RepID=UPI0019008F67|nr:hypothetical protein [Brevibacillus brevis]MBH0331107.1 hypothetical protein [Brevibacillus brevis]
MNQELRIRIKKLIGGEITDLEFLDLFKENIEITSYFDKLLEVICTEKNKDDLGLLFYIGFTFDLFDERHLERLTQLITEAWHTAHEDIAGCFNIFNQIHR